MNRILTSCAILTLFTSFGQITINSTDCATAGNTVFLSQSNALMEDFATTGPNTTWDFSNLTASSQNTVTFGSMSGLSPLILLQFGNFAPTKYKATYWLPTNIPIDLLSGILPVEFSDINQYTRLTSDSMTLVGISMNVSGFGVPTQSDTIETRLKFPLNYGDSHYSRGYTQFDLNPIVEAMWTQSRTRTTTVDGWGSVTTPFGTFNALRVKHVITENDLVNYQGFEIPLPIPSTTEYEWWANGQKVPVLKMTTVSLLGNEQLTAIEYLDEEIVSAGIETQALENASVYPNPTNDQITLKTEETPDFVEILDFMGNVVLSDKTPSIENTYSLEKFSAGVYQLRISIDGDIQTARVIKH